MVFFLLLNDHLKRNHDKKSQIFEAATKLTELSFEQFWKFQERMPEKTHKIGKPPKMFALMYAELNEIWNKGKRKDAEESEDTESERK